MHQFSQDAIVAARLHHPELTRERVAQFGTYIADFHELIERTNPTIDCVQVENIENDAVVGSSQSYLAEPPEPHDSRIIGKFES